jgi:hypothetical protein
VVEHLLERSLDPALDAHLGKVKALLSKQDHAGAGELFFDFRVADLAMGSGHFLTSAIDHIEQRMAAFLAEDGNVIPGVTAELLKLESAAIAALGPDAPEPERSSLLRRQIARRCIYGLDINPIAVELARVSIWIHTFVRGLPMSSLDHNLVCANSLTGIGSVEEALDVLVPGRKGNPSLFDAPIEEALEASRTVLIDAALLAESTKEESRAAFRAGRKALKEAEAAKLLFDAAVLTRIGLGDLVNGTTPNAIAKMASSEHVQAELNPLKPAHMPVLFPEVFLRDNAGFDVLIGNPPWKEVMVDETEFWLRFSPGLLALPMKERDKAISTLQTTRPDLVEEYEIETLATDLIRSALVNGPYEGIGSGGRAPDLYAAFAWRFWQLLRTDGRVGAVFPRSLLNALTNSEWREVVLANGDINVVNVVNTNGWVFPSVHGQYSITFIDIHKTIEIPESVQLSGPFFDFASFERGRDQRGQLPISLLRLASESAAFPQLPDAKSAEVFSKIRQTPRLDDATNGVIIRPISEFNATTDRPSFDAGGEKDGRVPVFAGSSFNLWDPNYGKPFAFADARKVTKVLYEKRLRQINLKSSGFYGMEQVWAKDEETLSFLHARIAYRQITNATNTRTVIAALVPPNTVLTNASPFMLVRGGSVKDEAFLLAVMCSIPFDWYIRRYVELNFNFHLVNSAPIPSVAPDDPQYLRAIHCAGNLAAVDMRYAEWAKGVGVKVGSIKSDSEKDLLTAEIDALVAHLYGLNRTQLEHVFKTFHRGWDYAPRLEKVLSFYDKLPKVAS